MAERSSDHRGLLRQEGSDLSEASTAIDTPVVQYISQHRPSQRRISSPSFDSHQASIHAISEDGDGFAGQDDNGLDWGRGGTESPSGRPVPSISIVREFVRARRSSVQTSPSPTGHARSFSNISMDSPHTPGSAKPLLSPAWVRFDSPNGSYGYDDGKSSAPEDGDISKGKMSSFREDLPDEGVEYRVGPLGTTASSISEFDDKSGPYVPPCHSKNDIHTGRSSWLSMSILILSIYSTAFSGIWLVLALVRPRYGRAIHSGGKLSPSTASIVFALFAKTIELSFVTVFVTFLGQVLSRRSLVKTSRGVTIAEMSMRTWVIQPGFLITHWKHLRHVGVTLMGCVTFVAALVAMFYTTASDALVSPHLKYGGWESKEMYGVVKASYANPYYIEDTCQTPVSKVLDPLYAGTTCLSVEHAGQAYHNFLVYMDTWASISASGIANSTDLALRPPPVGLLYDNTTVTGSWVQTNTSNMSASYEKYSRVINNVTVSMPHAGVFAAAKDRKNGILQPAELAGVGEYSLRASVVSPTINVLCVNMNATEISPLIYVDWPNAKYTTGSLISGQRVANSGYADDVQPKPGETYLNSTVADDIFKWGAAYGRQPPVFPMLPIEYNSLTNISVPNSDSIYLLVKAADSLTSNYTLCQIQSYLSPNCSTQYSVSGTGGGQLVSNCEDPDDTDAYSKSVPDAPITTSTDWRNVISQWALSLSLNTGISNANSSTSRLLSQFISYVPNQGSVQYDTLMPSIAEALAVMSGCTLLLSTTDSSFYHYWEYNTTVLDPGVYQDFNASISSQQYTSGYTQPWQSVFYLVLLTVFCMNVFCLVYFFIRAGLVTDFTEPPNLFALAINSPPSQRLSGSCGGGPEGHQLNVDFHVSLDERNNHVYIKEGGISDVGRNYELRSRRGHVSHKSHDLRSMSSYSKLSTKRRSWL